MNPPPDRRSTDMDVSTVITEYRLVLKEACKVLTREEIYLIFERAIGGRSIPEEQSCQRSS